MFSRLVSALLLLSFSVSAQEPLRGFTPERSKAQQEWEAKFRAVPDSARQREYMRVITAEPHHAGSPASRKVAQYILGQFRSWGLDASIEEFQVLLPTPRERVLEMIEPEKFRAQLREPVVPEDPDSGDANQLPTYNAYSADGDVTAPLVYVNYGVPEDYEQLRKLGIDVRGKIVIARYGQSWRGIKPKVAAENGALACIIYSDPKEDGYFRGDVYPEGAFRPDHGAQRGSVMDMPIYPGDPLTPGWAAEKGARRLRREEAQTLMKIPVLPISYADAIPLLRRLRGPVAPEPWRGALPLTYHVGPGPAVVHLKAAFDWEVRPIYNVIARIRGSEFPDEWIIQGNHHDAWVNGASDPTSGNVALMETARGIADMLKQGWRPRRTIIFASWDAEEWGLIGSTEWAEKHAKELAGKTALYINSDSNGRGTLRAGGSHSLEKFVNEVSRDLPDVEARRSVWEAQRARLLDRASEETKKELASRADLRIEALGSGSDYTPFIQHLGIPSLNISFGGEESFGGIYHSIYDSFHWFTNFSDKDFTYGRLLSQWNGTAVMRLASADVLPFEFTNLAETVERYANEIEKLYKQQKDAAALDFAPLREGVDALKKSAAAYQAAAAGGVPANVRQVNAALLRVERAMTTERGLLRRGWFRHHLYAPGAYTGYAVKTLPGVREAVEAKNYTEAAAEMRVLRDVLRAVAAQIDRATAAWSR